ncbi:MAG: hypothetical protein JO138_02190 [Acidobacteriaceae bacterium]|nr:hypothetical protein [Acidobacteriaceae bacterium]
MRARQLGPLLLVILGLGSTAFAQLARQSAPVPADPLELAMGPVEVADTADKRAAILALLERARQNNNLHAPGSAPYRLRVSFNATGTPSLSGPGEMEEIWLAGDKWRWSARLGSYSQVRIWHDGIAYDTNAHAYLPLRLKMLRGSIFWPVAGQLASRLIRIAPATSNGKTVTCALISGAWMPATAEPGRRWQEQEFCIDPNTGLLQTYSVAPGIYAAYDYSSGTPFHGSTVPRVLSIVVAGETVLQAQISIEDAGAVDEGMLAPTQQMHGPGAVIVAPMRFAMIAPGQTGAGAGTVQPVIIHAAVDANGHVLEAEALQTSNDELSRAALDLVKRRNYGEAYRGETPLEREIFVNVEFR